tara:strand:+ start:721 stop:1746 length:1026 start_codon:yes stop_codon:yes gene_type:complete
MNKFVLFLFLICFCKFSFSNNLFETSYYDVEFFSNNIENDKINEINEIKKRSLINILKKTLSNKNYTKIQDLITVDLSNSLIKNIIINEEKIINNKYISRIKVNFDKKKIIEFYRQKKLPYIEFLPNKFLLIIYEEDEINHNLFTKDNSFYSYYKKNLNANSLFRLPNLDINDRFILRDEDLKKINLEKIKTFLRKYNLVNASIILANKNNKNITYNFILYSDGEIINKKLDFNSLRLNRFFVFLENETVDSWKNLNQIQNNTLNVINCKIDYFNMPELKEIRNKLNNITIIQNLKIKSLSYKNIEYEIYFYGNLKILSKLFNLNKLNTKDIDNACIIKLR